MALADKLDAGPEHGRPCSVGAVIDSLDEDDRATLLGWLGTPEKRGLPAGQIFSALAAEGHRVGYQTINRHRGGTCRCSR